MAMVRTSLQKVVVFLHRLQRMAISSPRYQKLCKVCGENRTAGRRRVYLLFWYYWSVAWVSFGGFFSYLSELFCFIVGKFHHQAWFHVTCVCFCDQVAMFSMMNVVVCYCWSLRNQSFLPLLFCTLSLNFLIHQSIFSSSYCCGILSRYKYVHIFMSTFLTHFMQKKKTEKVSLCCDLRVCKRMLYFSVCLFFFFKSVATLFRV